MISIILSTESLSYFLKSKYNIRLVVFLAKKYETMDNLMNASFEELQQITDIGEIIAKGADKLRSNSFHNSKNVKKKGKK